MLMRMKSMGLLGSAIPDWKEGVFQQGNRNIPGIFYTYSYLPFVYLYLLQKVFSKYMFDLIVCQNLQRLVYYFMN